MTLPSRHARLRKVASAVMVAALSLASLHAGWISPAARAADPDTETAQEFRERFGLSTSATRISELAEDPSANREFEIPLTENEAEEMHRRGRVGPALQEVRDYIAQHPSRFGSLYIDNPGGGLVVVGLTRAGEGDRQEVLARVPSWIDVRFEDVSNSVEDLEAAHEAMNDLMREDDPRIMAVTGVDQMLGENVLRVRVLPERMGETKEFLRSLVAPELLRFEAGGYDQPSACNSRTDCWADPIRGGIRYDTDGCTIGFMVYNSSGVRRLVTAGHCLSESTNNARWHHNSSNSIGKEGPNSFWDGSYSDLGILNMSSDEAQGMSGHVIYRTNSDNAYSISGQNGPSTLGEPLNMAGITTGSSWGEVVSVNHTSNWGGGFYLFYTKVGDYENALGDSGAPVVYDHVAVGVQSGCVSDPGEACTSDASQDSVFSSIDQLWIAEDGPGGSDFHLKVCRSGDAETSC